MPTVRVYQIDAFTREVFAGNPAAVCPLETWLDVGSMLAIAAEMNLSETAFFAPEGDAFRLRWFTPVTEVHLCGHATLASAFVLFNELGHPGDTVRFETKSGPLWVKRDGDLFVMDFPARNLEPRPDALTQLTVALGAEILEVFAVTPGRSLVAVLQDEAAVDSVRPDFGRLAELHRTVAITAPGDSTDCASRYFAPDHGIPEDPVTGSIHCALVPYWAQRLGKKQIHARQVSERCGELYCEERGDRVLISGHAVKFMEGTIHL